MTVSPHVFLRPHRLWPALLAALALAAVLAPARGSAHDEFRFVGPIVTVDLQKNRFAMKIVENRKEETIEIALLPKTEILRDKKPVPRATLKPGLHVVVDALGDDYDSLEAVTVRIVPAPK